jgi:hypothetical protein
MSDGTIDRTVLPIRRPPFAGETKKTLEGSVPDWNQAARVEPPVQGALEDEQGSVEGCTRP